MPRGFAAWAPLRGSAQGKSSAHGSADAAQQIAYAPHDERPAYFSIGDVVHFIHHPLDDHEVGAITGRQTIFKPKIVFSTVLKLAMAPSCAFEELPLTVRYGVGEAQVSASLTLQHSDWVGFDV